MNDITHTKESEQTLKLRHLQLEDYLDIEEIIDQIYIGFFDDDPDKNFAPS
jgi:hypothetical protein